MMTYPSALSITKKLITLPTVNPPRNELAAQDYLQTLLKDNGFTVQRLAMNADRPNLVTRLPGRGERPPLPSTSCCNATKPITALFRWAKVYNPRHPEQTYLANAVL
jgi:hypothetical protein